VPVATGRLRQLPLPMVRLTAATGRLNIGLEMPLAPVKLVVFMTGRPRQLPRRTGRPRHPAHLLHPAVPLPLIQSRQQFLPHPFACFTRFSPGHPGLRRPVRPSLPGASRNLLVPTANPLTRTLCSASTCCSCAPRLIVGRRAHCISAASHCTSAAFRRPSHFRKLHTTGRQMSSYVSPDAWILGKAMSSV